MRYHTLSGTVATAIEGTGPAYLADIQSIEVQDEASLYEKLTKQLIALETTVDYTVAQVVSIEQQVLTMMFELDEKEELLMRCEWLVTMKDIEGNLRELTTIDAVKAARSKLGRVQTCSLKNVLTEKITGIEAGLAPVVKQLSQKANLVEAVLETGNETFINLGSAGREAIVADVLENGRGTVEEAIKKAMVLEIEVQAVKAVNDIQALQLALQSLPLTKLAGIPTAYKEEVLQNLLDNPNWNGLFHLDRLIHQYTIQVERLHTPVQEGVQTTLMMNNKLMEQFGVQQTH